MGAIGDIARLIFYMSNDHFEKFDAELNEKFDRHLNK